MGLHDVRAEDIHADEVLLAGKANFHFAIPFVGRSALIHSFFKPGQLRTAQVTQMPQRLLPVSRSFFYVAGYVFRWVLHNLSKSDAWGPLGM